MENFVADMHLMFNNAKLYNADESQIFADAHTLQVMTLINWLTLRTRLSRLQRKNGRRGMQSTSIED